MIVPGSHSECVTAARTPPFTRKQPHGPGGAQLGLSSHCHTRSSSASLGLSTPLTALPPRVEARAWVWGRSFIPSRAASAWCRRHPPQRPLPLPSPGSILPVTVYDQHGFRVLFHFARDPLPGRSDVLVVVVSMLSTAPHPIRNIVFQSAVPKVTWAHLPPQGRVTWAGWEARSPGLGVGPVSLSSWGVGVEGDPRIGSPEEALARG